MGVSGIIDYLKGLHRPFSVREFEHEVEGGRIYGKAFIPKGTGPFPLCVVCHGLDGSHTSSVPYAEHLAERGVVGVVFDFRGGSRNSRSSGSTLEMSLVSEAADLNAILDLARSWDFVDTDHVWISGRSQGGAVCAYVAAERPKDIEKMVLLYPAFNIGPALRAMFHSKEEVPEKHLLLGSIEVGSAYALDVWDYRWQDSARAYAGPVLIIHGTEDPIVDPGFSEEAAGLYADARLVRIEGAGHGFKGDAFERATDEIARFLLG